MRPFLANLILGFGIACFAVLGWVAYRGFADTANGPGGAALGGPFNLVDQNGHTVTDQNFHGKWMLVYFGYTHCPAACPTALNNLAQMLDDMKDHASAVVPIFITIDPDRDTPSVMKDYVSSFGPEFVGLSGNAAQITAAETQYHVTAERHAGKDGEYDYDHSSMIYVMDPAGRFSTAFFDETDPQEMATRLLVLSSGHSNS